MRRAESVVPCACPSTEVLKIKQKPSKPSWLELWRTLCLWQPCSCWSRKRQLKNCHIGFSLFSFSCNCLGPRPSPLSIEGGRPHLFAEQIYLKRVMYVHLASLCMTLGTDPRLLFNPLGTQYRKAENQQPFLKCLVA